MRQFYHGEFKTEASHESPTPRFRTLDLLVFSTSFAVWNDTQENDETLARLEALTRQLQPVFILWNGDQSNDIHFERDMADQFLTPTKRPIANQWPLAYVEPVPVGEGPREAGLK